MAKAHKISLEVPASLTPDRAIGVAREAVRIEARRMTELLELFEREDMQRLLLKVGKHGAKVSNFAIDDAARKQQRAMARVIDRFKDFGWDVDEDALFKEGFNAYLVGTREYTWGSYDVMYTYPGRLTIDVHDGGGHPVESVTRVFEKEYKPGVFAERPKV